MFMERKVVLVKPRSIKDRLRAFFLGEWRVINGSWVRATNFVAWFGLREACSMNKLVVLNGVVLFDGFFQVESVWGVE